MANASTTAAAATSKKSGKVKWFNVQRGFGFITPDDGGDDLFVHQTSIIAEGFRSLGEGENVEFSVEVSSDGRAKASDVTGPNGTLVQGSGFGRGGGGGRVGYDGRGYGMGRDLGRGYSRGREYTDSGYGERGAFFDARGGRGRGRTSGYGYGGNYSGYGGAADYNSDFVCYNCGEPGHFARDCSAYGPGGRGRGGRRGPAGYGRGQSGRGYGGGDGCYNCGEYGHLARDCPN